LQLEATADILEREAFIADESDIMSNPLVRTTEAFLVKHLNLGTAVIGGSGGGSGGKGKGGGKVKGQGRSQGQVGQKEGAATVDAEKESASEPNIVLFISLSGGKIFPSLLYYFTQSSHPQPRSTTPQAWTVW